MPRKNPTEQTVDITIDGEIYNLVFNLDAIAEAEEMTGIPLITGLRKKEIVSPKLSLIRAMLWASMHTHHPKITPAEAAALVDQWNCLDIWGNLLNVWTAGMKQPAGNETSDPQKSPS